MSANNSAIYLEAVTSTAQPDRFIYLQRLSYEERLRACQQAWNILCDELKIAPGTEPWQVLSQDMNGFIKEHTPPMDQEVARAGFQVAMCFDRVELAGDFLQHIRTPTALTLNEFLHKVRLAMQWGSWGIEPRYINKWLAIAEEALSRCADLDSLSDSQRHYCHEVLLGRLVKVGSSIPRALRQFFIDRLSGKISSEDIERLVQSTPSAIGITRGEITLSDLSKRLAEMSTWQHMRVVGLSIIIADNFVSYVCILPNGSVCSDLKPIAKIRQRVDKLRDELDEWVGRFADQSWDNLVPWPDELKALFDQIFQEIFAHLDALPGHVLLAINAPYNGLPWQQLVAVARGAAVYDHQRWARSNFETPSLSLIANFGSMLELRDQTAQPNGFTQFPATTIRIQDTEIRSTLEGLSTELVQFRNSPTFSLSFLIGHGPERSPISHDGFHLPKIRTDIDAYLDDAAWTNILDADVVFLGSCGVGSPNRTFFGDVGGALSRFLMKVQGMLLAPVAEVSPDATVHIARYLLSSPHRGDVLNAYRMAWSTYPECYLYNLYGYPLDRFQGSHAR